MGKTFRRRPARCPWTMVPDMARHRRVQHAKTFVRQAQVRDDRLQLRVHERGF
jgi:hypothetical protein